jgi:hypothetical protein
MRAWQFNNPPWGRQFPMWRKHGSDFPLARLFYTYKGRKYHVTVNDACTRYEICTKCGPVFPGMPGRFGWGYRNITHEPLRNSTLYQSAEIIRLNKRKKT